MSDTNSIQRNDRGLLEGVEYVFNEKGLIDWRKMLDNKWLYPNPSKNLPTQDVTKLKVYFITNMFYHSNLIISISLLFS